MTTINNDLLSRLDQLNSNHWINYPISIETIAALKQLIDFKQSHRPSSLLIISETNNGKTIIAKRFIESIKPEKNIDEQGNEVLTLDAIMIQCPHIPDEKLFYYSILDRLNILYKASSRKPDLLYIVMNALKRIGIKILIIDEIQHLLVKTTASKQREILNLIKYLSNELGISIVGIGTIEAYYVINSDPQLANRFNKIVIPKWKFNKDFLSFLATYQQFIVLKNEYTLLQPELARQIYDLGEGLLGEYVTILKLLGIHAIKSGEELINIDSISKINYTPPSKRRSQKFSFE